MKPFLHFFILSLTILSLISCNLYTPFNTTGSDLDKLEEAQKCLSDSNYDCALEQYEKLEDNTLKQQKLCQTYLSRGGVTLTVLVNSLNQNSSKMLPNYAQKFVPWTSRKSADLDLAKTHCVNFNSLSNKEEAVLLKTIALFSHCAIRMARTDMFQATHVDINDCTTPNAQANRVLSAVDIGGDSNGELVSGSPGMCKPDVDACASDIQAISSADLNAAGFTDLAGALSKLPTGITDSNTNTVRAALKGTFN
ncbi:MAG: hypothetical protein ACKOA8_13795 [Deltaproteobacteria bacterium]